MERPNNLSCLSMSAGKITEQRNSGRRQRYCERCRSEFGIDESYYLVGSTSWHVDCFLCSQCFEPLQDGIYFQLDDRMYCEHDFNTLYAPICSRCETLINGQVIFSANCSFHARCFTCENCEKHLEKTGAYRCLGKLFCFECYQLIPKEKIYNCHKCHQPVEEEDLLHYKNNPYHAYHFNCTNCRTSLDRNARNIKDELFCSRCYDLKCDVCFDCKVVIDPQVERSIYAMDKHWHVQHFRCATCLHPFNGHEHYEKSGKAYCKPHFLEEVGHHCFYCDRMIPGLMIRVFGKTFCPACYRCRGCDRVLKHKDKVMEIDMLPLCKKCMGNKTFKKVLKEKATMAEICE